MPFIPFHEAFPDLAAQETRTITTLASAYLPAGSYTLIEMYCDEPHCDCRRVFLGAVLQHLTDRNGYRLWMGKPCVLCPVDGR